MYWQVGIRIEGNHSNVHVTANDEESAVDAALVKLGVNDDASYKVMYAIELDDGEERAE